MPVFEYGKMEPASISNYRAIDLKVGDKLVSKSGKRTAVVSRDFWEYRDGTVCVYEDTKADGRVWSSLTAKQVERLWPTLIAKEGN